MNYQNNESIEIGKWGKFQKFQVSVESCGTGCKMFCTTFRESPQFPKKSSTEMTFSFLNGSQVSSIMVSSYNFPNEWNLHRFIYLLVIYKRKWNVEKNLGGILRTSKYLARFMADIWRSKRILIFVNNSQPSMNPSISVFFGNL